MQPYEFFWNGHRTAGRSALKCCIAYWASFAQLLAKKNWSDQVRSRSCDVTRQNLHRNRIGWHWANKKQPIQCAGWTELMLRRKKRTKWRRIGMVQKMNDRPRYALLILMSRPPKSSLCAKYSKQNVNNAELLASNIPGTSGVELSVTVATAGTKAFSLLRVFTTLPVLGKKNY